MKKYVILNEDNSIQCISDVKHGDDYTEVEVEDGFDDMAIAHLRYQDGKLVEDEALKEQEQANKAKAVKAQLQKNQLANIIDIAMSPLIASKKFTATTASKVSSFAPLWSADWGRYEPGVIVTDPYDGLCYICNEGQGHTSQVGWEPHNAASLWSLIKVAPDGNREWVKPTGAQNDYEKDELCWYPDFDTGSLYRSKQNGNVWSPDEADTWTKVQSM